MYKIDSHQHFWKLNRGDYKWLTPSLTALYRDFIPEHLEPLLKKNQITHSILVQAADSLEESQYMLALAEQYDFIAGVIAWVNMDCPSGLESLKDLSKYDKLKGIRPMIQDIEDDNWMLADHLAPIFNYLQDNNLVFEALVLPRHLEYLITLQSRYPDLSIVIAHAAKPFVAQGIEASANLKWAENIKTLATMPNVYCKLSGLLTEAGECPTYECVEPFMRYLLVHFTAEKLLWGSDWPVLNLASDYDIWVNIVDEFVSTLGVDAQESIWANTAKKLYKLS